MSGRKIIGCVYVIEFEDGTIKAGRTNNKKQRIKNSSYGHRKIVDYWASRVSCDSVLLESMVLRAIKSVSNQVIGREYFTGVSFDVAVEIASEQCRKMEKSFDDRALFSQKVINKEIEDGVVNSIFESALNIGNIKQNGELNSIIMMNSVFYAAMHAYMVLSEADVSICDKDKAIRECKEHLLLIAKGMCIDASKDDVFALINKASRCIDDVDDAASWF